MENPPETPLSLSAIDPSTLNSGQIPEPVKGNADTEVNDNSSRDIPPSQGNNQEAEQVASSQGISNEPVPTSIPIAPSSVAQQAAISEPNASAAGSISFAQAASQSSPSASEPSVVVPPASQVDGNLPDAPIQTHSRGIVIRRSDRKHRGERNFYVIIEDLHQVQFYLGPRDRPQNAALMPGALVWFKPETSLTNTPLGTFRACSGVSQITSPPSSFIGWPTIKGRVCASPRDGKIAVEVPFLSDTSKKEMHVHLASLTKHSVIPDRQRWVKLFAYVKLKQGKQYLQIHHMEIDQDREKNEAYLKRSFILPPLKLPESMEKPNVFIGNYDPAYEGTGLIMDCWDIAVFFEGRTLENTGAGDILRWLAAKYHQRKEYILSHDPSLFTEQHRQAWEADLERVSNCDRIARRIIDGKDDMRILINTLAWGKDQFRKGQWTPADWNCWIARQFSSPLEKKVASVDMLHLVPRGATGRLLWQLGGFENLTVDTKSINYLHGFNAIQPDGLIHMGSLHPMNRNPDNISYTMGDDLHGVGFLHFEPHQVWREDGRPFPIPLIHDQFYSVAAKHIEGDKEMEVSQDIEDESKSSKDIRASKIGLATSVIFQIYIAEDREKNLKPLVDLRDGGKVELLTTNLTDWATYQVELETQQLAEEFIDFYNSVERKGVYTAMSAAIFFTDWHEEHDDELAHLGQHIFNITVPSPTLNPGQVQALFPGIQLSITGPGTLRCYLTLDMDVIQDELLKSNREHNARMPFSAVNPRYITINSSAGDMWLVKQGYSAVARSWLSGTDTAQSIVDRRSNLSHDGRTHTPTVIENVPHSLSYSDVIKIIIHFGNGKLDFIDTTTRGLSIKERPLLIVSNLSFKHAKPEPLVLTLSTGQERTFTCTPFDTLLHKAGVSPLGLIDSKSSQVSGSHLLSKKRQLQIADDRDAPYRKHQKAISEAIAQSKARIGNSPPSAKKVLGQGKEKGGRGVSFSLPHGGVDDHDRGEA